MKEKVYQRIQMVGCSSESIERAVALAIAKAAETVPAISWFEVLEIRGAVADGAPAEWQVTVELGCKAQ